MEWLCTRKVCSKYMMRLHTRMNLENFPRKRARTYLSQTIHRGHLTVTLKSTSSVTQVHWKRNHWTDHTRLTIRMSYWT